MSILICNRVTRPNPDRIQESNVSQNVTHSEIISAGSILYGKIVKYIH